MPFIGSNEREILAPASDAIAVTKSDTTVLVPTKGLYIGGTGAVTVTMASGNDVAFAAVPAGTVLPIRVIKVKDATVATNIVALY